MVAQLATVQPAPTGPEGRLPASSRGSSGIGVALLQAGLALVATSVIPGLTRAMATG